MCAHCFDLSEQDPLLAAALERGQGPRTLLKYAIEVALPRTTRLLGLLEPFLERVVYEVRCVVLFPLLAFYSWLCFGSKCRCSDLKIIVDMLCITWKDCDLQLAGGVTHDMIMLRIM